MIQTIEVKGKDVKDVDTINLTSTEAKSDEEVFFVKAANANADVKVYVADASAYAQDKWTDYSISNTQAVDTWGTFYLKAVVTSEDGTNTTTKVIKVVAATEVVPTLTADASATSVTITKNPTAGTYNDGAVTLAQGTSCTVADLKAVLTLDYASSNEIVVMKTGNLGGLVKAADSDTVVTGMKIVANSAETGDECTWTITINV